MVRVMEEPISLELILLLLMLQTMFSNTFSFSMRQWIEASYFFKSFLPIFFFFFFLISAKLLVIPFHKIYRSSNKLQRAISRLQQHNSCLSSYCIKYIFKTWWSDNIHSHYNISIINGKNVTIYIHQSILEISDYLPIFLFLFPYDIRQLLGYYSIPSNEQGTSVLISRKYCTKWCFQIPIYEIESLDKFGRRLQCFHEFIRQCHGFGESDKKKFLISSVVKRKRLLKE